MKKFKYIICITLLLSVAVFAFAGCGGAAPTQRIIGSSTPWITYTDVNEEISTYTINKVTKEGETTTTTQVGEMTYTFRKLDGSSPVKIGGTEHTIVGYYISQLVTGEQNDDKEIFTQAIVDTNLRTLASYSKTTKTDDSWTAYEVVYDTKNCLVTATNSSSDAVETTVKIGKGYSSEPYYDNAIIYTVARSLPASVSSYAFKSISFEEYKTIDVTLNRSSNSDVLNDIPLFDKTTIKDVATYKFTVSNALGTGAPIVCYVKSVEFDGKPLNNGILKIVEGNIEYVLSSFKTA